MALEKLQKQASLLHNYFYSSDKGAKEKTLLFITLKLIGLVKQALEWAPPTNSKNYFHLRTLKNNGKELKITKLEIKSTPTPFHHPKAVCNPPAAGSLSDSPR